MPKSPTRPTQYPSPQWARALHRGKPRHSCRGGRPRVTFALLLPAVGQILDLITVCVCVNLFGPKGFYVLLEMIDFVGFVGAFVPTATLVARSYWKEH